MKKAMKILAAVLVLVLVIGAIPVQAASTPSLKSKSKILYLGGCKGKKANGTAAKFYETVTVSKLLKSYKSSKMTLSATSTNAKICTVTSKGVIKAVGRGTAKVNIVVTSKSTQKEIFKGTVKITVKKSADEDFPITGIEDGDVYETGKKVTVVMTRANDDDYRLLTCDNSNAKLAKKNTYGSKYVVTFSKAGTYNFTAITYQSATYDGATAKKTFTVTVKDAEKPTPTPTATPTEAPTATPTEKPTDTPTPTPTTAPSEYAVKQTALDTVVITGIENAEALKATDFEVYYFIANSKVPKSGISEVSVKDGELTLKMISAFLDDTEYYISYTGMKGDPLKFKSVKSTQADIAKIGITTNKVLVGTTADLGIRYYNKDGVDITVGVEGSVIPALTVVQGDMDAYAVSGKEVYFITANKTAVFEITVMTGTTALGDPITVSGKFTVSSFEPQSAGYIYTITTDDGVYMKPEDEQIHSFTIDTPNPIIEVLFKYVDAAGNVTYKTLDEEGVTKIKIADENFAFDGLKASTGGYGISAHNTGSTNVVFYKGDKAFQTAAITILAEKKANSIAVTSSKKLLNVNGLVGDKFEITAVVKDQYGNEMKGQPITIEQNEATKVSTGTVSFGAFDANGKLTVNGYDVLLAAGKTNGVIVATVSCGNLKENLSFQVANYDKANTWVMVSIPDAAAISMDTCIKAGDSKPSVVSISIEGKNNGFSVSKEILKFWDKQPSPQIKASDLGVAAGTTVYLYTIQKDGKYLTALPSLITDTSTEIVFKTFDYGQKLEKGNYVVTAYSILANDTNSTPRPLGSRTIVVSDNQTPIITKFVKDSTASTNPIDVVKECYEFYIDGKKLDPSCVTNADVAISTSGSKVVRSAEITITNTIYGNLTQTVQINGSVIH